MSMGYERKITEHALLLFFNMTLDILSGFSVSSENSLSANNVKHAAFQLKIDNDSFSCSHSNVTVTHFISIKNVSGKT